jgi:predicted nucleic acid-binding protein
MSDPDASGRSCFIDTNIWLYAFVGDSTPEKTAAAQAVIRREPHVVVSTQVINEVAANLLKKAAFAEAEVRRLVTSFYRRYQVIHFNQSIMLHASILRETYSLSFWDSLIAASALEAGAGNLYSEDMQDGLVVEGRLAIINPLKSAR